VAAGSLARPPDPAVEAATGQAVTVIRDGFARHQDQFEAITRRAARRQQRLDWHGMQRDAVERLGVYAREAAQVVQEVTGLLGEARHDRQRWAWMKDAYQALVSGRPDAEIAQTFFNSVSRRVFATVGFDPRIEYADAELDPPASRARVTTTYPWRGSTVALVREILAARPLAVAFQDLDRDARLIAGQIDAACQEGRGATPIESVEMLDPVFYRNKGLYLIGRVETRAGRILPLVVALVNDGRGVAADAVLLTEDEASIVFSFTRASFHVDVAGPRPVIDFLRSIMPAKRVAELYIALGYHRHGKAELYRDFTRHLARSADRFEIAPGEPGMVMVVFTLPSYDIVFKVIRDSFVPPKSVTRRQVLERYQIVFKHDRAGRLVDAQAWEHLAFPRERFSPTLLAELQASAASSVLVDDDRVVIRHLYTERRVTPLNLYLRDADARAAREAVLDHGRTIRDLAATNIFPGDLLLKNFGVTRHGRVIFYDYDELCFLTDLAFREMPAARDLDDEMAAEPWFTVRPGDVFPEEFITFLGLWGDLRQVFLEAHGDLLTAAFWNRMQALHRAGEVVDIFPYRPERRLRAPPGKI
jgi:isocitrate dehydrogenase kinase/phosphatase